MEDSTVPYFKSDVANPLDTIREHLQTSLTIEDESEQLTMDTDESRSHSTANEEESVTRATLDREPLGCSLTTSDEGQEQETLISYTDVREVTGEVGEPEQLSEERPDSSLRKPLQSYVDGTLPDLLRSGSPLRRRVSSPVSDTLKQVRREVELSRRRSLRLKAQVEKLQEKNHDGPGWSQHRERVTEEVQSILRLLLPLTDLNLNPVESSSPEHQLDSILLQLQHVARKLALDHTSQKKNKDGDSGHDAAVLQQALRDRDDAIERKKAMEAELLQSKTELMLLNNQLLEAVQRRLEISLELEAWKDDVQYILNHQLQSQQQAEQSQRKPSRMGVLRRGNKVGSKNASPATPSVSSGPPSTPNTPIAQRWKERLRRGRTARQSDSSDQFPSRESQAPTGGIEDTFHTISLD
ncbi:bicaudal-D-related protein 2-like [Chanos chanos]|uniref:Bicaudal-D-related protein 2-like n=1 Tax=Chanos chanos TaxID=29144 RepID=A0A6J2W4A9_CHACN|nr:BICD family-like cargo adapter 2 [Chanos chanos]